MKVSLRYFKVYHIIIISITQCLIVLMYDWFSKFEKKYFFKLVFLQRIEDLPKKSMYLTILDSSAKHLSDCGDGGAGI